MSALSTGVLIFAALTTIALIVYVRLLLPRQLEVRFLESMMAFSRAVELRFPMNSGKTAEIIELSKMLGRGFGMSKSELHELELAAHLRDIGCCAIPYRPFNEKDRNEWTEYEARVFAKHPEVSGAMLELVPSLKHIASSVRWHHTRYDGSDSVGCPTGESIPLHARILKVSSDYVWKESEVGPGAAALMIQNGVGTEYCPEVVEVFVEVLTSSRVQESQPRLA